MMERSENDETDDKIKVCITQTTKRNDKYVVVDMKLNSHLIVTRDQND